MMKCLCFRACFFGAAMIVILSLPARASAGDLDVSPPALFFGRVTVGRASGPREARVGTYFGAPIRKISVSGDFSQTNDCPAYLQRFGSCRIFVTFKPLSVGQHTGHLRIVGGVHRP